MPASGKAMEVSTSLDGAHQDAHAHQDVAQQDGAKKGSARRDLLVNLQKKAQQQWLEDAAFEIDAPRQGAVSAEGQVKNSRQKNKWLVTFPYPYMNGRLHLGHGFSLTKAEFSARFRMLEGRRVLFPFGFHCTGMPICAAAHKLEKQLAEAAREDDEEEEVPATAAAGEETSAADRAAAGNFKTQKSKAVAKGGGKPVAEILKACGVADALIPNFIDPKYWLEYFPPFGISDLQQFGLTTDWRRSFITTDANPYYDAFIRWQFNILKKENYIQFGTRASIFDPVSDQPCADHDRASGEGVGPQEYVLIKMQVLDVPAAWTNAVDSVVSNAEVKSKLKFYLVAATLRAETMCGQTNCFVLPEGEYSLIQAKNNEVFVCGERAARNMVYQETAEVAAFDSAFVKTAMGSPSSNPKAKALIESIHADESLSLYKQKPLTYTKVLGKSMFGLKVKAPLTPYPYVHVLPLFSILMNKGTGVVTSVPADAPDDFAALNDWQTKPKLRDQWGIQEEWVKEFKVVNVINTPEYGDACAPVLCAQYKVESQKDKDKLKLCKEEAYKKGFYSGKMIAGPFVGVPVADAKKKTAEMLISQNEALKYYEPEKEVMARTGVECIVAFCDQWYIDYANEEWTKSVREYVGNEGEFESYGEGTRNGLLRTIDWMKEWACSRTFGLGTKLPWDPKWLIESLSDSTIYMAYYSISHLLQGGLLNGIKPNHGGAPGTDDFIPPGPLRIRPEQLTDGVFDYVFDRSDDIPADCTLSQAVLTELRNEFQFWYPVDIRCSGKDLIQNHLTMSLFNHAAIWKNKPQYWPKSFYANGHILVDNEKMSKNKGNFMTMQEACETYSADVVRLACADAGDTLEDANYSTEISNQSILRMTSLLSWANDVTAKIAKQGGTGNARPKEFMDLVFENELIDLINKTFKAYETCQYKDALKWCWYEMENLRKTYCDRVGTDDWHPESILRFLEVQALTLSPICPHFCEQLWREVLNQREPLWKQKWPTPKVAFDKVLHRKFEVLEKDLRDLRMAKVNFVNEKKKRNKAFVFEEVVKSAVVYVAVEYKEWQKAILSYCQTVPLNADQTAPADPKNWITGLRSADTWANFSKEEQKKAMPFASFMMKDEMSIRGPSALELTLPFNEREMLEERVGLIKKQLGIENVFFRLATEGKHEQDTSDKINLAQPAKPSAVFLEAA
ncbi:unnamed protein product [Amoebophrya sp. A25]|nr:unnamed protein product [Amoebophrya sp. A25]|eukprot:GSA25T00008624001.1